VFPERDEEFSDPADNLQGWVVDHFLIQRQQLAPPPLTSRRHVPGAWGPGAWGPGAWGGGGKRSKRSKRPKISKRPKRSKRSKISKISKRSKRTKTPKRPKRSKRKNYSKRIQSGGGDIEEVVSEYPPVYTFTGNEIAGDLVSFVYGGSVDSTLLGRRLVMKHGGPFRVQQGDKKGDRMIWDIDRSDWKFRKARTRPSRFDSDMPEVQTNDLTAYTMDGDDVGGYLLSRDKRNFNFVQPT